MPGSLTTVACQNGQSTAVNQAAPVRRPHRKPSVSYVQTGGLGHVLSFLPGFCLSQTKRAGCSYQPGALIKVPGTE